MKIKVKFYATFKELFGAEVKEIELKDGSHIQDLLNLLCNSRQCSQEIFDQSGNISRYIKILKNGRHIEFLDGVHTELGEGDVVAMFPPMGGG
jgi:molybdopterin synthase sulfur carrier subunit